MRPWPLLLLAASSDARCRCDRRVIVATTVNGVRTASLLVPSAARVGAALVVYHEDSADAAAGLEPHGMARPGPRVSGVTLSRSLCA